MSFRVGEHNNPFPQDTCPANTLMRLFSMLCHRPNCGVLLWSCGFLFSVCEGCRSITTGSSARSFVCFVFSVNVGKAPMFATLTSDVACSEMSSITL